jgi:diadenosine tetraphosphate (Ap4A) HIT family hydrolase
MEEIARASVVIKNSGAAKLNIGALGNLVPQLHVHVVGRNPGDPAWPGPVWGHSAAVPYDDAARAGRTLLVISG